MTRKLLLSSVAMVLGFVSWVGPEYLISGPDSIPGLLFFPPTRTNVNLATLYSVLSLTLSGVVLTLLDPKHNPLWGAATALPMIILSTIDGMLNLHRHNLYGIEIVVYILYSTPAILGGVATRIVRWGILRLTQRRYHSESS